MLSEICAYLKNWFNDLQPRYIGKLKIVEGQLNIADKIQTNQYYRITGSVFNDGVYQRGKETLSDEEFEGGVWLMAIPKDFLDLVKEIEDWQKKYGGAESSLQSPFSSENFAGVYSYSKASGGSSEGSQTVPTWQNIYASRLRRFKKI